MLSLASSAEKQGMCLPACETASKQPSLPGMQPAGWSSSRQDLEGSTQHGGELTLPETRLPMGTLDGSCTGARTSANVTTTSTQVAMNLRRRQPLRHH